VRCWSMCWLLINFGFISIGGVFRSEALSQPCSPRFCVRELEGGARLRGRVTFGCVNLGLCRVRSSLRSSTIGRLCFYTPHTKSYSKHRDAGRPGARTAAAVAARQRSRARRQSGRGGRRPVARAGRNSVRAAILFRFLSASGRRSSIDAIHQSRSSLRWLLTYRGHALPVYSTCRGASPARSLLSRLPRVTQKNSRRAWFIGMFSVKSACICELTASSKQAASSSRVPGCAGRQWRSRDGASPDAGQTRVGGGRGPWRCIWGGGGGASVGRE